jgi:hypothetical protein
MCRTVTPTRRSGSLGHDQTLCGYGARVFWPPRREQSAESVAPPGAIPDGATAGTGAM